MSSRSILSMFFLSLMALNSIGYYSFLLVVKDQLSQRTRARLETSMHDLTGNLIVKVPVSLPYGMEVSGTYEASRGEIIYEGNIYQRIKQRLYGDTLYVMCVSDYQTTAAKDQIDRYSQSFAGDNSQQDSHAGIRIISSWAKYYFSEAHSITVLHEGWGRTQCHAYTASLYAYNTTSLIFHPPAAHAA
jgi:hypothetical protein